MKISLKSILITWLFLFAIIGGLFYSAYSKLNPDSFVALIKEQVEKNYPGSSLNVGSVKYSMAVDFSLNMQNLTLTRSGNILGSIGELEMRIPWWLLILNRGSAHINLSNVEIYVDHEDEAKPDPIKEVAQRDARTIRVVLPGYLSVAQYTIKAKNISVRDRVNARRYFRLSKFLVREFQDGKNSAFELNVPIEINHRGSQYIAELWLFGDVTPEKNNWRLNYRGEFRGRESHDKLHMEDLIIDGRASFNPSRLDVQSNLTLLVEREEVGEGAFNANDSQYSMNLKLNKFPTSFLEIVKEEVKNPFLKEISSTSSGTFKISKTVQQEYAQINGKLGFDGSISLGDSVVNGKWQIVIEGPKWETSFISPKGEVSFFRRSLVDFGKGQTTQYNEEIGFSGVDLRVASYPFMTLGYLIEDPSIVHFNSTVSLKKCIWDKQTVNGEVKYGISPDQRFYVANLSGDNLGLTMNYQEKATFHQIAMESKNFPLNDQFKMFEPFLMAKSGLVSGKLEGKWTERWPDGTWLVNLDFVQLDGMKGQVPDFLSLIAKEFSLDYTSSLHQTWSFAHRNLTMSIQTLLLDGVDPAKITGQISENPKIKSNLVLSYPKNKTWKPVRKELTQPLWLLKEQQ